MFPILGLLAGLGWWAAYRVGTRRARWVGLVVDRLVVKREGGATYSVDYISVRQREQVFSRVERCTPEHRVWINGIEYARIYHLDDGRCQERQDHP